MSKHSHRSSSWSVALLLLAGATGCIAQNSTGSGMGSETNWLATCEADSDCDEGSCLCGVCTITCSSDSACSDVGEAVECISTDATRACSDAPKHKLCGHSDTRFRASSAPDSGPQRVEDSGARSPSVSNEAGSIETAATTEPVTATEQGSDGGADPTADPTEVTDPTDVTEPSNVPANGAPSQADVLFVVDNSIGMTDKRMYLEDAASKYVQQIYNPPCVSESGEQQLVATPADDCPAGSTRMFEPITDIHVGVITTSLGGYGAQLDCGADPAANPDFAQAVDMAHLLAALPRGAAAAPDAAETGFFEWNESSDVESLSNQLGALVHSAGVYGCGWEAPMEAWYRFLVEPYPHTKIVRQACSAADTAMSCSGPEKTDSGDQAVDDALLAQRNAFLRPNSLLTIVTLGDENDCSFKPAGQGWRLAQSASLDDFGALAYYPAFRGTDACTDPDYGPNSECCHSCGQSTFPIGCPTAQDTEGTELAKGCENGRKYTIDETEDHPNLRCFNQKQRFGVDYLLPVERYSNALTAAQICPATDDNEVAGCAVEPVDNPLFAGERPSNWIVSGNIVGAPWQDLAVSADASDPLEFRSADPAQEDSVDWDWLIGERYPEDGIVRPTHPLMLESVEPRTGTNPATGEALAAPDSSYLANSINGHEWSIADGGDLQFACTYAVAPRTCLTREAADELRNNGDSPPDCACSAYGGDEFKNPLCQSEEGAYSLSQVRAGAYPSTRQLQVAYDVAELSVVGSVCPKVSADTGDDYGYRPFVRALLRHVDKVTSVE